MKYGTFFSYWEKDWKGDFFKYVRKAKDLGLDVLEVSAGELLNLSKTQLQELNALSKDLNILISSNIGPAKKYDVASSDPETRKRGIKYLCDIMDSMSVLGSEKLVGVLYSFWPYDYIDLDKEGNWDRGVESCKIMGRHAEALGIDMCLEVVNRFESMILNTAEEAVRYVKEVDNPNVKILLDTFHMNIEEDYIPDAIRHAGKLLGHVHVGESNRKLPFDGPGSLDWRAIGTALNDIGYDQYVIAEPFVTIGGQIAKDIKVWRDLSGNADEAMLDEAARDSANFLRETFKV